MNTSTKEAPIAAAGESVTVRPACKLFNGRYTVENRETGDHRTFMIKTQAKDAAFRPGERIISLLTGPNNEEDYTGFGFVTEDGVDVFRKKRGQDGKRSEFEIYAEMLWTLALDGAFSKYAERYFLLMEGRCVVCNRALTTPESIRNGIGPICAEGGAAA